MEMELQGIGEHHDLLHLFIDPNRVELRFLGCSEERAEGSAAGLAQGTKRKVPCTAGFYAIVSLVRAAVLALLVFGEVALVGAGARSVGEGTTAIAADQLPGEAGGCPPLHHTRLSPSFPLCLNHFM